MEIEVVKCECCGLKEECTEEYINKVKAKFEGKWLCGLCSEAVRDEVKKQSETITLIDLNCLANDRFQKDSMEEDKDRLVETDRLERGLLLDRAPDSGQFNNDDDEELPPLYIASFSEAEENLVKYQTARWLLY
ncbi:uncharacterized protein LOC121808682 [Salvia splendens]|uniref:uncharacterized protein LOC121808682 n=1 Tax=Salvia splendens TaxID=180675 RepID=UPI001C275000|nr:uncharacterized protein LOC121808682 [Salvia splendens]